MGAWGAVVAIGAGAGLLAWLALGWVPGVLARYRATFTQVARVQLSEFFLFIDPVQLWIANLVLCTLVGALVLVVTRNLLATAVALAICVAVPRRWVAWLRRARLARFDAQLPDALLALASALRAGAGTASALRQIVAEAPAPLAQEFGLMLREQRLGVSQDAALAHLARRMPSEATALVVSAMRIAADTGGNLAEALERIATLVRARLHMEGRIDALTAQGRMQAWVVGCLPVLLATVLHQLEPEAMSQLWRTPPGWATLSVLTVMETAGIWMVRRIVRIRV